MRWLSRLLGNSSTPLSAQQFDRLETWQTLPPANLDKAMTDARYVVVDVETSGLNLARDRLIAIGAVAVYRGRIALADSMEVLLQQEKASDKRNILVHGISGDVQRGGMPPVDALLNFLEFVGKDPLIAYHAPFDRTMLDKAMRKHLGIKLEAAWMDLAHLAPALCPELPQVNCSLDFCTAHFGIASFARHSALSDAFASAELLLTLRSRMASQQIDCFRKMQDAAVSHRRSYLHTL